MGDKKRINVGMFINSLYNDYATLVCKGAITAAEEFDVNLLFVPGREINAQWSVASLNRFEYQNNTLYSYLNKNNIDVLIMSLGTFAIFLSDQEIQDFLKQYEGVRIVIMEMIIPGYPCILFGTDGLRQEIEHLIKDHGYRKIAFLAGQKGQSVSESRLGVYKEVLAENGIEYNESYVEYGDFSEWCVEKARILLDRNINDLPEAICCANDSMVKALDIAMKEKGLEIGKDIFVTGYDDADFAGVMNPPLTTVKSYMMTMGYEAVSLALKYYEDGENEIRYVKTALLKRSSCGCPPQNEDEFDKEKINIDLPREEFSKNLLDHIAESSSLEIIPYSVASQINDFTGYVYDSLSSPSDSSDNNGTILKKIDGILNDKVTAYFNVNSFHTLFTVLQQLALEKMDTEEKRNAVHATFGKAYFKLSSYLAGVDIKNENTTWLNQFLFARITDEMMIYGKDEEQCFQSMADVLSKLNDKFYSCYIYIFHNDIFNTIGIKNFNSGNWHRPDNIYLRAYYQGESFNVPDKDKRKIDTDNFMLNPFVDLTERKTFALQSLFFNEEQYGIVLLECGVNYLSQMHTLIKQISTAIKMTRFTNLLENALNEVKRTNEILSHESVSDQLTSLYNRRGFVLEAEKMMKIRSREGFKGAVLFADLDYLKIINDTFGHKNGDFAIQKAASLLRDNLRKTDITGRIGGDEFVSFIPDTDEEAMKTICQNIKNMAAEFNKSSDKPYNVNVSLGFCCFDSADNETVEQLMTKADRALYENKKLKSKTVIKGQSA